MGGFFLMRDGRGGRQEALRTARDQFMRLGFSALVERHVPGWTILHAPYIIGGPELVAESGDSFAIAAGTLAYNGQMGPAALKEWLAESRLPHFDQSKLAGQFGAVLHQRGRTFIRCTPLRKSKPRQASVTYIQDAVISRETIASRGTQLASHKFYETYSHLYFANSVELT